MVHAKNTTLKIEHALPHPQLAPYISAFVQRDFRMSGCEIEEPVVARLGLMLEFQFRDLYQVAAFDVDLGDRCSPVTVIGPISRRRIRLVIRGTVSALAVIFTPSGFHRLFGVPASPLAEMGTEGHAVLGAGISNIYQQLGNTDTFARRVLLLNSFFLHQVEHFAPRQDALSCLRALVNPSKRRGVAQIAKDAGLSSRQLERKCLEYFGVSPVMLARISRFQRALRLGSGGTGSWMRVAHASDYYDQMHMVRDFHAFAGGPPTRTLASLAPQHLIHFQRPSW
jgi:AraC-like DNA-binding protein